MERLKSRDVFPPDNWWYRQIETTWFVTGLSFGATVDAIIRHRKGNPHLPLPTDYNSVAWELEQFTIARLSRAQKEGFVSDLSPIMASTIHHEPPRKCKTCGR